MIFQETAIGGVILIKPERHRDERGYFARTFARDEFERHGLITDIDQCSASFNARSGTLRGMHYQQAPHGEAKLVRCVRGAIYDVALDLRPESPTFLGWHGSELTAENGDALFIPVGCAHGFQTLADDTEVLYQISHRYVPEAGRGVRWDDPRFAIAWPEPPAGGRTISGRDAEYPDFAA